MHAVKFAVVVALAAVSTTLLLRGPVAGAFPGQTQVELAAVRAATAQYHVLSIAKAHKYALLTDAAGIACIDNLPVGTMGVHFVNGDLVGSGKIRPLLPQALVYEPGPHGQMHLVAVEYIAFQAAWDATHKAPPTLFGQQFMLTTAPNRFGLPAFYSLHAWIWKHNPSGTFSMWNPTVHCPASRAA
jgi:hypothetical protein